MKLLKVQFSLWSLCIILSTFAFSVSYLSAAPFSDRGFGWNPGTSYRNTPSPYDRDAGYQNFDGYNSYRSPYYYNPSNYNDWRSNRNYAPVEPYESSSYENSYYEW